MDNISQKDIRLFAGKEEAIENLGGMVWLYEKHLNNFKIRYADSTTEIQHSLLCGNVEKARIMTHSIKGLSGTLGLNELYIAAASLEQAIITRDSHLNEKLIYYDSCLKEILESSDKD